MEPVTGELKTISEITFSDGRNRNWCIFNDSNFFNYFCIKCEDGTYFHISNYETAKMFCDLIKITY